MVAPADGFVALRVADDRTVRLLSLGGAATDRLLSRIAAGIDAAVDEVVAFWGTDWSHDIFVVAAGSDEQFHAAAGGGLASQWADIAAITVVDRVDPARRTVVGQRIVFAPGAAHMSPAALRIVLGHELFHYAARATRPWMHLDGWPRGWPISLPGPRPRRPRMRCLWRCRYRRTPTWTLRGHSARWHMTARGGSLGSSRPPTVPPSCVSFIWPLVVSDTSTWLPPPTTSSALTPLACSRAGSGG